MSEIKNLALPWFNLYHMEVKVFLKCYVFLLKEKLMFAYRKSGISEYLQSSRYHGYV